MAFPLAQTIVTSAMSAAAGKGVEQVAGAPVDKKSTMFIAGGLALLALYFMSKGPKLKYVEVPKNWAKLGGIGLLAYGAYCWYKAKKPS